MRSVVGADVPTFVPTKQLEGHSSAVMGGIVAMPVPAFVPARVPASVCMLRRVRCGRPTFDPTER